MKHHTLSVKIWEPRHIQVVFLNNGKATECRTFTNQRLAISTMKRWMEGKELPKSRESTMA